MSKVKARIGRFSATSNGPVRVFYFQKAEFDYEEGAENMTLEQAFVFIRAVQLKMIGGNGYGFDFWSAEYGIKKVELYGLPVEPSHIVDLYRSTRGAEEE